MCAIEALVNHFVCYWCNRDYVQVHVCSGGFAKDDT